MAGKQKARGSILLKIIIVLLLAVLIYTLWQPYEFKRTEARQLSESRLRMTNIRNAQMFHYREFQTYQRDLDTLITWIKSDSLVIAKSDSLFRPLLVGEFVADSLRYSPRTHRQYIIEVDDSSSTHRYYIECPDGFGFVSSIDDLSQLHRPSWE
jgi:hypothetical protein